MVSLTVGAEMPRYTQDLFMRRLHADERLWIDDHAWH